MGQFNKYSSSDASGPGLLTGQGGTLILLLNACLIDGYTGHAAPSPVWTHPIATASNIASYKQGGGSGFGFVLNDNQPNATPAFKEAWAIGWKVVAGVGSAVGSGTGQFPLPAQLLTTGHVVWRKSTTSDTVGRAWVLYADDKTFYLFVLTGDIANTYLTAGFGDIFSFQGTADANRCFIAGRRVENSGAEEGPIGCQTTPSIATHKGLYMADTLAGTAGSQPYFINADTTSATAIATGLFAAGGLLPTPNSYDNSFYAAAQRVMDASWGIRGRYRGLYVPLHPAANFADGQTITGANDYAGKTFQVISKTDMSTTAGGLWLETSATVETN